MRINRKLRITVIVYRALLAFYTPRVYRKVFTVALVLSLIACTKDDDEQKFSDTRAPRPQIESNSVKSEAAETPNRSIKFTIKEEASAVQLVASAGDDLEIRLLKLTDPKGKVLFDSERIIDTTVASAAEFQASPHTFNYPQLSTQKKLITGEYTAEYETQDANNFEFTGAEISLDVIPKNDSNLENGIVNVNFILGGIATNTKETRNAIESAADLLSIMLERYGIAIFPRLIELPETPEVLPNPQEGDVFYEETSKAIERGINIFFVNAVQNANTQRYNSATAGSSPGPVIPTRRSAIAVSITNAAGSDGRFDSDDEDSDNIDDSETRLLAESLAHEILSYMGLNDTVTFKGGTVSKTDGLDSEKCSTLDSCEDNKGANGNIMFPFPLNDDDSSAGEKFYPRDRLSPQQVEIAQRYVGMD